VMFVASTESVNTPWLQERFTGYGDRGRTG
jgi:hypothetical protein